MPNLPYPLGVPVFKHKCGLLYFIKDNPGSVDLSDVQIMFKFALNLPFYDIDTDCHEFAR